MFPRKAKQRHRSSGRWRTRRSRLEILEQRRLLAANPLGATPLDTGEFLLGRVAVTPVFFESDGIANETQNWDAEEIDEVLAKIAEGVNWWSGTLDQLNTVHTLEFVIDDTFARDPFETPYEPIDNSSALFSKYVGDFLIAQGADESGTLEEAVYSFNSQQRAKLGTDWSFTIFVVDASDDLDGFFAPGEFRGAFAYSGGLFIVTPSTRPASTIAHEMGHIFGTDDEYSGGDSWTATGGYYNAQNLNAADNPTPGFQQEISIMRDDDALAEAYQSHVSPASTLAMLGWRDSDGDGVFDLADVPLDLDAVGYFDSASSRYHFTGSASAVPLLNQNSSGNQSDITLNRVSQLQYRLDGGPWQMASQPDQQVVDFDISINLDEPFSTIDWRAIDLTTGIVSPTISGTSTLPALPTSSLSGLVFVDDNANGQRDLGEEALSLTEVTVRNSDGSPLFAGSVDAADYADGNLPNDLAGVTLSADGQDLSGQIGSFVSQSAGNQRVFHAFDVDRGKWLEKWSKEMIFEAEFDSPVGEVQLTAIGLDPTSFARMEAYDAAGQLLGRFTSDGIGLGQSSTLHIADRGGRITSIRAFGHADSKVALNDLRFGFEQTVQTDRSGAWKFQNLPDGDYLVQLAPERLIHQFAQAQFPVEVVAGTSQIVIGAAERVDSPWHNQPLAPDANRNGRVTTLDALVIINDLGRYGPRALTASDLTEFDVDVSNDGFVSSLDALRVINYIASQTEGLGEGISELGGPGVSGQSNISSGAVVSSGFVESADHNDNGEMDQRVAYKLPPASPSGVSMKTQVFTGILTPQRVDQVMTGPSQSPESEESIAPITSEISEPFPQFVI